MVKKNKVTVRACGNSSTIFSMFLSSSKMLLDWVAMLRLIAIPAGLSACQLKVRGDRVEEEIIEFCKVHDIGEVDLAYFCAGRIVKFLSDYKEKNGGA